MSTAIALETGYFGAIREPGQTFPVPAGTKSNRWFVVDGVPFIDEEGKVYDKVLDNEVLLPGVVGKKPTAAESNVPDELSAAEPKVYTPGSSVI
jgi:hypothetical protein